jgi:hypothetical protein
LEGLAYGRPRDAEDVAELLLGGKQNSDELRIAGEAVLEDVSELVIQRNGAGVIEETAIENVAELQIVDALCGGPGPGWLDVRLRLFQCVFRVGRFLIWLARRPPTAGLARRFDVSSIPRTITGKTRP